MSRRATILLFLAGGLMPVHARAATDADAAAGPLQLVSWEQGSGTTVALVEDHRVDLVHLRVSFPSGTLSPWGRARHAEEAFAIQLHDPAGRLRARADRLGVTVALGVREWSSVLTLDCHRDDLDAALALVKDVLANRDFDRAELKRRGAQRRLAFSGAMKEPSFVLWREASVALFPGGDPRRTPYEKPPKIESDAKKLAEARDRLVRLPGRVVGWGGAIGRAEADERTRGLLPEADAAAPPDLEPRFAAEIAAAVRGPERSAKLRRLTQVYFADVRTAPSITSNDYPAFLVADHVLGGHFYSRLYEALRHESGDTYGAATRGRADVAPSAYGLWTFTRTANADATARKLRATLARFFEQGITEDERAVAAGFLVGRQAFDRQSPADLLEAFAFEHRRGLPRGFRDAAASRAAALPLGDVNAFIRRFYDPAAFTLVKVVPR
jgi:zinc protease